MMEVWLDVVGWEGVYETSSFGRVRRVEGGQGARAGAILIPRPGNKGYLRVALCKDGCPRDYRIHILVCRTFHGPPVQYINKSGDVRWQEVRHLDGDDVNYASVNLCWGTSVENSDDSLMHGTRSRGEEHGLLVRGEKHHNSKLTEHEVREIKADHRPTIAVAKDYGVSAAHIRLIKRGKTWAWLSDVRNKTRHVVAHEGEYA